MGDLQANEFFGIKGWPLCGTCKKPVERMEVFNDINNYTRTYRAICHGEKEDGVLTDLTLMQSNEITFSTAFNKIYLENT
jgi:hypothetical protein